ncbi:MAG TPA: biotin/lipoyl-binding protein, partial [Alphaproteobacteria bacterium]|nr:biotin/lipoyl-binding protein [Alphaproteobacteria bacterium]
MTDAQNNEEARRRPRMNGRLIRYVIIAAVAVAAGIWGFREISARLTHVYEYDARIATDLVTVSSKREGQLVSLNVEEGDRVERGDILAQLDDRIPRLEAEAIQARLKTLEAERTRYVNQQVMLDQQTGSRIASRNSELEAAAAKV